MNSIPYTKEQLMKANARLLEKNNLYRETIEFAINHLSLVKEIGQVDMVINQMKDILEDEE